MELEKFFNPRSVALVGASEQEGKVGNAIAKNILNFGYSGKVFFVNPKHEIIFGQKCHKFLGEIGEEIDLAIIAVPAEFVNEIIKKSSGKIKNFVVISAGFSETGNEGKEREAELKAIASENNVNILGPNCLGFINPFINLNASFAGGMPEKGNIALVSQSGALAVAMLDLADKENVNFSRIVSIGNKMQIGESDLLVYLENDENTKVIGMYLEGIDDGEKFTTAARRISQKKPVVILKAGKSEKAQKAIASHTGALAVSDSIVNAVFENSGILRAENLGEFFDLLSLISVSGIDNGKTVVVTNAGGPGVLATDAISEKEIKLAELDEKTRENLKKVLPAESSVENPVDLLGDADEKRYEKTLKIIGKQNEIGNIICILTPQDQTPVNKIASKIIKFKKNAKKNILAVFIGGEKIRKAVQKLKNENISVFAFPERAVAALDKFAQWKKYRPESDDIRIDSNRKEEAEEILKQAKSQGRNALLFSEAKRVMERYGIKTIEAADLGFDSGIPENLKFPVAAKIDSDKVLHKTDKKGLILDIKNQEELASAIRDLRGAFPGENIIVQPMLSVKTELILGIKRDDIFGPVIVFGLGGIYAEIFKMVDFMLPSFSLEEIKMKLERSKIKFLFERFRGQEAFEKDTLADILIKLSQLAKEVDGIKELDINPLLAYNDGKDWMAVDVKIII